MKARAVVVGAGVGGLTAALALARHGFETRVIEARAEAGGLASGFSVDGFQFDSGPYILLDRPGLEWAFAAVGLDIRECVRLRRIEDVYQLATCNGTVRFFASAEETAAGFDAAWPGSGSRYLRFLRSTGRSY